MNWETFSSKKDAKTRRESLSRREFLKQASVVGGAGAIGLTVGQPILETLEEAVRPEDLERELERNMKTLIERWNIALEFDAIDDGYKTSQELSPVERRDISSIVVDCLELYPLEYTQKSGLRKIRAVKHYKYPTPDPAGVTTAGYVSNDEREVMNLSTEPAWWEDAYRDMDNFQFGWGNASRMQAVFHHEFYHIADEHLEDEDRFNQEWIEMNREGGGEKYFAELDTLPEAPGTGFVSVYARSNPNEDRAEIAKILFTQPAILTNADGVLQKKVDFIKNGFRMTSGGIMDEFYWKLVAEGDKQAVKQYVLMRENLKQKS